MSLLTAEQRAIFDETVRLRQLDALNGGEAGLDARDAKHHGHLNKHHASLLPGNRVKKGENNRIQVDLSDAAHPIYVLDHGDPNYDSGEEPYKLKAGRLRAPPRADVIVAYKSAVATMVREYFSSGDVDETARTLDQMEQPLYQHYFVKKIVTLAMDRSPISAREANARDATRETGDANAARARPLVPRRARRGGGEGEGGARAPRARYGPGARSRSDAPRGRVRAASVGGRQPAGGPMTRRRRLVSERYSYQAGKEVK